MKHINHERLSTRKQKKPHREPSQTSSSGCKQWRSHNMLRKDIRIGDLKQCKIYNSQATIQPHQANWTRLGYSSKHEDKGNGHARFELSVTLGITI